MTDAERTLTPAQARAARALLGWSQKELATRAAVAETTVTQFERGNRNASRAVARAMRSALEAAGVEFIASGATSPPGGEGVRLRADGAAAGTDRPRGAPEPSGGG